MYEYGLTYNIEHTFYKVLIWYEITIRALYWTYPNVAETYPIRFNLSWLLNICVLNKKVKTFLP